MRLHILDAALIIVLLIVFAIWAGLKGIVRFIERLIKGR